MSLLAKRIIPERTAYVDVSYAQTLALSTAFQAGVVGWVAFWTIYGQGLSAETLASIGAFGAAYMLVIVLEPLADLGVLAVAKAMKGRGGTPFLTARVHHAAA